MSSSSSSSPTAQDFERLTHLGLRPHWLTAPEPSKPRSGKNPIDKGWAQRSYSTEVLSPPYPGANLGLRTGRVEGAPVQVVVVDLDSDQALAWAQEHLPSTPWRTRSSKGEHWYYRYPDTTLPIRNKCRVTLSTGEKLEIDVRGDGGNVVVAPSVHSSGHTYTESTPWDQTPSTELPIYDPAWFGGAKSAAAKPETKTAPEAATEEPDSLLAELPHEPPTERPGLLPEHFQARIHMYCSRAVGGAGAIAAIRSMMLEQPYAPHGERNNLLFQATRLLAEWLPEATDEQIEAFARASLLATGSQEPQKELETFRDGLRRSREKFAQRDHLMLRLFKNSVEPTPALIDAGVDLRSRLILTFGSGNHLLMLPDGSYSNSVWRQEKLAQHINHANLLGWAERAELAQFHYVDEKGKQKKVSWPTLAERHGWPVNHWEGSFTAEYSTVQGDRFIEAFAPRRRDLAPRGDMQIQTWLRLLGGDDAELLLDWLAGFTDLGSPTPALILVGARKAGKNLLAEGLARFWVAGAPIPFETTTRDFNDALQQCPLIFADEKLPIDNKGRVQLDEHLRQLVTARTHPVRRKYRDDITVHGCLRIIAATNHVNFDFPGMSIESKSALGERILHIDVGAEARAYLESLGGRATTDAWVQGDLLIRHVLYLAATRIVMRGDRLLVQGNGERLIISAQNRLGVGRDLSTWLAWYLEDPRGANIGAGSAGIVIRSGEVWICARILFSGGEQTWFRFVRHSRAALPPDTTLEEHVRDLSDGTDKKFRVPGGPRNTNPTQARYYRLYLPQFYAWADQFGFDVEAIKATIARDSGPEPTPGSDPPTQPVLSPNSSVPTVPDIIAKPQPPKPIPLSQLLAAGSTTQLEVSNAPNPGVVVAPQQEVVLRPVLETPKTSRHRKPCNAARVRAGQPCICPPAPEVKKKEKPHYVRESAYFTPSLCAWEEELRAQAPATEQAAVEFFAFRLTTAMRGHPSTFARLTAAYREYRHTLRDTRDPKQACDYALSVWFDTDLRRPWFMDVSLTPAPSQGGVS